MPRHMFIVWFSIRKLSSSDFPSCRLPSRRDGGLGEGSLFAPLEMYQGNNVLQIRHIYLCVLFVRHILSKTKEYVKSEIHGSAKKTWFRAASYVHFPVGGKNLSGVPEKILRHVFYGSHALRGNSLGRSGVHKKTAERSRKAPTQSVGAIKEGRYCGL